MQAGKSTVFAAGEVEAGVEDGYGQREDVAASEPERLDRHFA